MLESPPTSLNAAIAETMLPTQSAPLNLKDFDLVCFSHLRWGFVFQRPQHLISRFAAERRVFFIEEPFFVDEFEPRLVVTPDPSGIHVVVPHLPHGLTEPGQIEAQRQMVDRLMADYHIKRYACWYYTPMALLFSDHLEPLALVYDCMDELSGFRGAHPQLVERERLLFGLADMVFTGGYSLYESKRKQHPNVYAFPSSVDLAHYAVARQPLMDPADQATVAHPRIGFFGVLDERMDFDLLQAVASLRPDWQFIMIGPVVKIDPDHLPRRDNIHYLGGKDYQQLPAYVSGWDVAMMPFAHNESTKFISPTKTLEYLAAGKPVVSTSIQDVVRPYGESGLVHIADTPEDFAAALEVAMKQRENADWLARVDAMLSQTSWDGTWQRMRDLLGERVSDADPRL